MKRGKLIFFPHKRRINLPTLLSFSRIILAFLIAYMVFADYSLTPIICVFAVAAMTDFFDGYAARRWHEVSEFGGKLDIVADRFLMLGTVLSFAVAYGIGGRLTPFHLLQISFLMMRELISAPFVIRGFLAGKGMPHPIFISKVTTFLQSIALPLIILSSNHPWLAYIAVPLSAITAATGIVSGIRYASK